MKKKNQAPIAVGDRVAFSRAFLQSTGQYLGAAPARRGKVLELLELSPGFVLALIQWEGETDPSRVNVGNLVSVARLHLEPV